MGSILNAVQRAKMELEIFDTTQDYWFLLRSNDCAREFNCQEVLVKKNCPITLDNNGRWFMPKGFKQILCIGGKQVLTNGSSNCIPFIYWEQPFLNSLNCANAPNQNFLTIQRNSSYIQFYGSYSTLQSLCISYLSYNVDEHGTMQVPDEFEEPIMYYLCMMWSLRHMKDYSQFQYQQWQQFYYAYRRKIISESNQVRFMEQRPQILEAMNTVLNGIGHGHRFH